MADIYPPDFNTPVGQLRSLISQTKQYVDPRTPDAAPEYLIGDSQLQSYIALNKDGLYGAAADALLAVAINEALVSKKIRTEDLQTDGPAVAGELRRLAEEYRKRQKEEDEALDYESAFEIVDYTSYPTNWPIR